MILDLRQGLADDGIHVPLAKLARWFNVPMYRPSENLLMLQGGFGSDEYDDGRGVQTLDGEA